jgi:hypothetical protein
MARPRSQNLASPIFDFAPPSMLIAIISKLARSWEDFQTLRQWNRVSAQTQIGKQIGEFASPNFPANFTHQFTNFKFASDLTNLKVAHQS